MQYAIVLSPMMLSYHLDLPKVWGTGSGWMSQVSDS